MKLTYIETRFKTAFPNLDKSEKKYEEIFNYFVWYYHEVGMNLAWYYTKKQFKLS